MAIMSPISLVTNANITIAFRQQQFAVTGEYLMIRMIYPNAKAKATIEIT